MRHVSTLFDLSDWTWIRLAGRDAHKFLHNFCTNDILKLPQTHGCEAFVTNVKARVLGHIFALEASREETGQSVDVFSFPGQEESLLAHLDRYLIREDVTLEARSDAKATFLASQNVAAIGSEARDLTDLEPFETRSIVLGKCGVVARRLDLLGEPGLLLTCDRENADHVREALSSDGAKFGSSEQFESRRIAAVLPRYGVDVSEDQLAPEVGRPWAISYTKGCYLGQEPIARIDALGHVNRLLRGLRLEADLTVAPGTAVLAEGKEVGTVTSSAPGLALAYLRSKFAEPETTVILRSSTGEVAAKVFAPSEPRP
jgi:folate-binding protein YgfZ